MDCGGNLLDLASLNADLKFGLGNEGNVITSLSKHFNETIVKTEDAFCVYDACSKDSKYEIKTRRNKFRQYPTTIIPVHKTKVEGRLVFVFCFTDGLYYIQYDPFVFATFSITKISAIRRGGVRTELPHYHIPIERLIHINI